MQTLQVTVFAEHLQFSEYYYTTTQQQKKKKKNRENLCEKICRGIEKHWWGVFIIEISTGIHSAPLLKR